MTDRKDKINTCMRGFLIFVNSLFMLFGIAIVVAGVYLLTSKWADIDPDLMKKVGAGLIGAGLLALFVACAGCVGAMKKIKCLLITYMMFVFLVMAACGGLSYVLFASEGALSNIAAGQESGSAEFESVSDTLQTHFDNLWCAAGINATSDFSTWNDFVKDKCNTNLQQAQVCDETTKKCKTTDGCAYEQCKKVIAQTILDYITPVAAGVAAFAGLQLLLVIASCLLCCYNKAQTLEEKYDGKGTFVEFY